MSQLLVQWTVYGTVVLSCVVVAMVGARLAWGASLDGTVDARVVRAVLWVVVLGSAGTLARVFL
jgi:hypothetical protein